MPDPAILTPGCAWTVVEGDCREILPTLAAGSVDAVVTDPPYGIGYSSNHGASWSGRQIANDGDTLARDAVVAWVSRVNLPWACFGSWKQRPPEGTRAVLVWDKGPAFGMGDLSLPWKPSWEEIYIGGPGWTGRRDEGVLRGHLVVSWESKGRCHPNEKPVSLMAYLLSRLPRARAILDPFCGSGTTGVACVRTGRKFLGIEIDHGYAEIARRRIAAEAAQGRLALVENERE